MADGYEIKIKKFFDGLRETLDTDTDKDEKLKELKAQRFHQGRPFSRNPFSDPKEFTGKVSFVGESCNKKYSSAITSR